METSVQSSSTTSPPRVRRMGLVPSWVLFFGVVAVPTAGVLVAARAGAPEWLAVALASLATLVVTLLFQWLWPYCEDWRGWKRVAAIDLLHTLVSTGATVRVFQALVYGIVVQASLWVSGAVGFELWPTAWPVWAQLGLALVLGDLGYYWMHRLGHEVPAFWRFHALHHSSEHLYVLAAGRTHPVNAIAVYACQVLPLLALGIPEQALLALSVFTGAHGLLQHANIRLRLGVLNWVFATPDLHRWHHSTDVEESCSNYGSNLILWDIVFGTRLLPADRDITRVGLPEMEFTRNFWRHLASPFTYRRLQVPDEGR